jgi:hypothetical protein
MGIFRNGFGRADAPKIHTNARRCRSTSIPFPFRSRDGRAIAPCRTKNRPLSSRVASLADKSGGAGAAAAAELSTRRDERSRFAQKPCEIRRKRGRAARGASFAESTASVSFHVAEPP